MQTLTTWHPDLTQPPFYFPMSALLKRRFGEPVYKVTIDAGFTCPNIDGSKATGGCTYCDNTSFSPALRRGDPEIRRQIDNGAKFYRERYQARKFLAYFQTYTNTYDDVSRLRRLYDDALAHQDIVGMSVGTRPDCIDAGKLALFQQYAERMPDKLVCIEYGMQTMHDATAERINRAHGHADTVAAVELTRRIAPDVHLCLHLIAGLPGENASMIRASMDECARLAPDSIKFHHCYVYENTVLARQWRDGLYEAPALQSHVQLAADCIERMPPATAIQRLVGEISSPGVLAPTWGKTKMQVVGLITDELRRRGTHQGSRFAS
ncbi:MAG: TIGR01212 family radical SAM protein [Planctomycetota bacterium]|nr:MAG: TIGR01212 family radical SAM protein [Planctomycetota bacterium]